MRKSSSLNSINTLKEMKSSNPNTWLRLIGANQKFRDLYGEDTAKILISLIEDEKS